MNVITAYLEVDPEVRRKLRPALLKWWLLMIPQQLMVLITYLLAPILPVFAVGKEKLPDWLSWFQTPRDPLSGGTSFQRDNAHLPEYLKRVKWIIRNPAYGWAHSITGTVNLKPGTKVYYQGDLKTAESHTGWVMCWDENYEYFQLKVYLPSVFGLIRKFRIGWKIHQWAKDGEAGEEVKKYLCTYNPLKGVD